MRTFAPLIDVVQCHLFFPISYSLHSKWGGPPGPQPTPSSACFVWTEVNLLATGGSRGTRADQGVCPTNAVQLPALGKLSGIAHECVRHECRVIS